jgi:hypothetical protein
VPSFTANKKISKMKKNPFALLTLFMFLSMSPLLLKAETKATLIEKTESAKAQSLIVRLDEIKAMDKAHMNFQEKRQLRKVVRSIKKSLNELGNGVYLSVGAIIIIILLLILLL